MIHTVLTPTFHPKILAAKVATNLVRLGVLAVLFFGMAATASAAGSGYLSLFGDVSETADTSCGAGQSRFNFVAREYNSEVPVSVANITVKTIGGVAPQTVSGDSNFWLTNTICVEVAAQAIEVKVDDGEPPAAFQSFFGSYTIKNPASWTGKRITSHVHLRRLGDGSSVSHGTSPEDKWYQTQPTFDVVVDSIPVPLVHSADGVHGIRLYTTPPATFWAYTTQTGGEGTYTVTLPPGSLTEGKQSWGFYVGLDGGSPDPISGWSGLRQFGLDATGPSPVSVSRSVTTVSQTSTFTVSGRATDSLSGLAWIGVYFDETLVKECFYPVGDPDNPQGPTSQETCTSGTIGPFSYGSTHTHEVRARDKAGNESSNTSSFTVACTKDSWISGGNPNQFLGCFYKDWSGTKQGDAPSGTLFSPPTVPVVAVALDYDWGLNPPPLEVSNPSETNISWFTTQWVGTFTFQPGSYRFYANVPQGYQSLYMWNPATSNWEYVYWNYGNQEFIRYFPAETTRTFAWTVYHSKSSSNKRVTFGWDQNILCDEQAFGINRFLGCAYNGTNLNYAQNVLRATTAPGPQLSDPVPLRAVALNNRWGYTSPDALVNNDYFFTRYKAIFNMPKAAVYRFVTGFDTGANVYFGTGFDLNGNLLNSELVSENWYNQSDSLESNPGGVALGNGGLNMYMLGGGTDTAYQYTLSTAWAAASADTAEYAAKAVAMEDTNPTGFFFKPDGTMMYMVGNGSTTKQVSQYSLSTPWDVTTATIVATAGIYLETAPTGVFIGNNGLAMYVIGTQYDTVHKYTLGTAWNVSTAVYANSFKSVSSQEYYPQDIFFNTDGKKMFIIGTAYDQVREYALNPAWDVATAVYTTGFNVGTQETSPTGMYFDPTGTKLYIVGTNNDTIYQYSLTTAWSVSTAAYDSSSLAVGGSGLDMFLKSLPAGPLAVEIRHYENYNNALLSFAWSEKGGPVIYCNPALSGVNQFIGCVYNGTDFTKRVSVPQDDVPLVVGPDVTDGAAVPAGSVKTGVSAYSYNWGDSSPAPAKVGVDSWSMEMSGVFKFPQGTYDFTANIACCNSFMYVYFDDVQVAYLTSGSNTFSHDFTNLLGENVAIKIRYANVSGAAQIGFSWARAATGIGLSLVSPAGTYTMFPGLEGPVAKWVNVWSTTTPETGPVRFEDGVATNGAGVNVSFPQIDVSGIMLRHEPINKNGASYNGANVPFQFTGPGGGSTYTWNNLGYFWDNTSTSFAPIAGVTGLNIVSSNWNLRWYPQPPADTMFVDLLDFGTKGFSVRVDSESGFSGTASVDIPSLPAGLTKVGTWPKTCVLIPYSYCLIDGLTVKATDTGTLSDIYKTYVIPIVATAGPLSTQTVGTVVTRGYDISVSPSNIPQFPPGSSMTYTISSLSRNSYNGNITVDYSVDPPTPTITMSPASIAMAPSSGDGTVVSKVKKVLENLALAVNWWSTNSANVTVNTTATTPEQEYTITIRARATSPEGPLDRIVTRRFIITSTPSIEAVPTDPDLTGQTLSWTGTAVAGNTYIFSAYAKNLSSTIPAGAMTARFCIDNPSCLTDTSGSLGNVAVPGLASLGAYEVTSSWIATAGNHVVYFCVDAGAANGVVTETNETNNCIQSASFTVTNLSVGFTTPSTALPLNTGAVQNTSVTIPYNSSLSFRYDSVDAVSCDYSDTTGGITTAIWAGGPTSSVWSSAGPYTGSFTRQAICTDANGNRSRPANLLVTVLPPPLILTLSANPPAGLDPLTTTLSAPVGGSATGFIDYYFWWNCSSASTDASLLNQNGGGGCGRLQNPQNGVCRFNNRGAICSQMNPANPWTSPQTASNSGVSGTPYANPGLFTAKVIVNRGGYAAQATTTVDVSTIPPQLQVFPFTLDFNDVVVSEWRDLTLRVTNVGRGVLTGSLAIPAGPFTCSPANAGGAAACNSFGAGLLANQSLNFLIRFTPPTLGSFQDNIAVTSNGGNATVGMIGRGVNALVSAGLNFGNVIVNRTKDLTFTLTNNSTVLDLGSGTLDFPVPFSCVSSSVGGAGVCSYNLTPGATNTFVIRFSPTAITSYSENATLSGNPAYTFPFTGNGVTGTIKFQDQ